MLNTTTIEAVYENGVLKPVKQLNIPEHKLVHLVIQEETESHPDILSLSSEVYRGLSAADIMEMEKISLDRSHFSRE